MDMNKRDTKLDAQQYYEMGTDYLRRKEYDKAVEKFSTAIILNRVMSEAYFGRALAYYHLKEYDNALKDYTKALELDPKNPVIYNNRGDVYYKKGDLKAAIRDYDKAILYNPNYMKAYYNRGLCYASLEQYDKAIEDFTKTIELEPDFAEAYYLRGLAYEYSNMFDEAIADFQKALELDPLFEEARQHLETAKAKKEGGDTSGSGGQQGSGDVRVIKDTGLTFKDLAGMEKLKEELRQAIIYPMENPELAREYGVLGGGGILMYGPPGCGKTYFVKAAAGEAKVAFINVKLSDILDMYVGNTEKNLHKVFEVARKNAPAILFFDEVDAIGGRRDAGGGEAGQALRSAINQFLIEMDGIEANNENVLVIAATNAPWDVDPALRRSGRFSRNIFVPPPDFKSRLEILKIHSRNKPIARNIAWHRLAMLTVGYSSADIKALVDKAATYPWIEAKKTGRKRKIKTGDYVRASDEIKSSLGPWYAQAKKKLGKKKEVMYIDGKKHEKEIESDMDPEEREQFKQLIDIVEKNNKWYVKAGISAMRLTAKYLPIPF